MTQLPTQKLFIGGAFVEALSGKRFRSLNPATNELLCEVESAGEADVERAVAAAAEGFRVWSTTAPVERGRVLRRAADILRERNDEIARLEVMDCGKPISESLTDDALSAADAIEFFAGLAPAIAGEHFDLPGAVGFTRREPLGVCLGIGAWNYPIQIAGWKSAPALAAGNAMIFKPSEMTPVSAGLLAEVYRDAGLPAGVFNVVHGEREAGALLVAHPGIAKVSLTGSDVTGRRVMADAAATLKQVTMELGGKSPLIVFDDADLDAAVGGAMLGNFYTQGEICTNGTRVFVQRGVHDAFLDRLVERTRKIRIGDPLDPETQMGALISTEHLERVEGHVARGIAEGARLVLGGRRPQGPGLEQGNFYEPTIFADCRDDMRIVREEIFGPVMSVLVFDDEDEAVARANDTKFGLAAGLYTRDLARAHRVVARLAAGVCWVNAYNLTPVNMPFGGYKQSGLGRENGMAALAHFTQIKSVYVALADPGAPF
ncbi:betaine-aldehyde dehydrogenase [Oceanibacterium hippocampi]|uniref:Betaine-aldehyde dehydrogenase n=1 Tax=Oceanibacterium hippocampi TaxID=745714 RepID=A0A1Y5S524_9PROT|nr:betaine-aldehyde dehydrogenase [Oceanibacterium hippocampi]SLN32749.1 NAD/NADP-dependent betaine aldehyde dehydrogenase [Oceanibacterium hippocampi]